MGIILEPCKRCGSTEQNTGLGSHICPQCREDREITLGPIESGLPDTDVDLLTRILKELKDSNLKTIDDALEGG